MAAVAERAGVSRRAVYLHFSSRGELIGSLLPYVGAAEDFGGSLQAVWGAADSASALDEWARHLARAHPKILAVTRAADRVRRADPAAAEVWDDVMQRWRRGSRRLVTWLSDEDRLAEPWTINTATDMMWALMSLDILERLTVDRSWSAERYADNLARVLRGTFLADDHHRPTETGALGHRSRALSSSSVNRD